VQPPAAADARVSHIVARHERALMRVALHWSLCRDDALDAYQRALEIYVRRIDSLDPATEFAWLKVVVKNEALAVRRQRSDSVPVDAADLDLEPADEQRPVDEVLAARERVARSAEALRRLKPDEAKALVLKAQGHSYQEIGETLGWTYTKVNRCITEGRARFLKVFAEIEAGAECERFAPTLAALVGGTAGADTLLELRPHIRNCAACRAAVRELHATRLGRLAALWPIPLLIAPLRWISGRATGGADGDYYPDADAVLRELDLPDPARSERLLDLKAQAYAWWHRLQGSDVAASAQLAASAGGGGRIATIGAIVGLCLSSLGAGTVCVVSGLVENPFEPSPERPVVVQREPKRVETPRRQPKPRAPLPTATPSPVVERPPARREPQREPDRNAPSTASPRGHEQPAPAAVAAGAPQDFAFEQTAPSTSPRPAPVPATGGGEFAP
jgi:RNA polymerase sigma factor (sigma-70 family)